jgi:hypothetical protein
MALSLSPPVLIVVGKVQAGQPRMHQTVPATPRWSADEGDLPPRVAELHSDLVSEIPCSPEQPSVPAELAAMPLVDLLGVYMNWAQRLIPPRKRQVLVAPGFWQFPLAKKYAGDVLALAGKIERGDDLTRHLSNRVRTHGYVPANPDERGRPKGIEWRDKDFGLNAFGVHHLHLQEADQKGRHGHSKDAELLYAVFDRDLSRSP